METIKFCKIEFQTFYMNMNEFTRTNASSNSINYFIDLISISSKTSKSDYELIKNVKFDYLRFADDCKMQKMMKAAIRCVNFIVSFYLNSIFSKKRKVSCEYLRVS